MRRLTEPDLGKDGIDRKDRIGKLREGSVPDKTMEQAGVGQCLGDHCFPKCSCLWTPRPKQESALYGNCLVICFPSMILGPCRSPYLLLDWTFPLPNRRGPHTSC